MIVCVKPTSDLGIWVRCHFYGDLDFAEWVHGNKYANINVLYCIQFSVL